jgi:hypothetical protein
MSYARQDAAFALRVAADLKAKGANVWLDQLDIRPGRQWDREVEVALTACSEMLVVLSPAAVESNNVMDEVAFALEKRKVVIPILHRDCPFPSACVECDMSISGQSTNRQFKHCSPHWHWNIRSRLHNGCDTD